MLYIDHRNRQPIYEQLVLQVRRLIESGAFAADAPLPSVRNLAQDLAINPNTIQKAYSEMERQGLTYSLPGRGSFVTPDIDKIRDCARNDASTRLKNALKDAFNAGINQEDIAAITREVIEEVQGT